MTLDKTSNAPNATAVSAPAPNPLVLSSSGGTLLTVGQGMEFATLSDACNAAQSGDTIAVKAGTYVNDFTTVNTSLRIVAVGGVVNEVATVEPPNGKALLTASANLSIQGFSFTGGSDGSPDGNVAGIRQQGGNLSVNYCYFHDLQDGLLVDSNPTATVVVNNSTFVHNGVGDGYSHNMYVNAVASFTLENSYSAGANVGHEVKSRAMVTNVLHNTIVDGATGTASYDIDIPNAGVAKIIGNIIEKGPDASNSYAIHYGGETQNLFASNSLEVANNTILNDLGSQGVAVLNQSTVNGLSVTANLHNNLLYGFAPDMVVLGAGTQSQNSVLKTEPGYSTQTPWTSAPVVSIAPGAMSLLLSNYGHTVSGGVNHLTINDTVGHNTISGGSGGLTLSAPAGWDMVTTQMGASDTVSLGARNCTLVSAGADRIFAPGYYQDITATGQATISGTGFNRYTLNGAGERLTLNGAGTVTVGGAGVATVVDAQGDSPWTLLAGGKIVLFDQAVAGATVTSATVSGGSAQGWLGNNGTVSVNTGDGGARVQTGSGPVTVNGGAGADTLLAGTGSATFNLGGGADQIFFGSGSASVNGGAGADSYNFQSGSGGSDTVSGFKTATDTLHFNGFAANPVMSENAVGADAVLVLSDGTTVTFTGLANATLVAGKTTGGFAAHANATLGGAASLVAEPAAGLVLTAADHNAVPETAMTTQIEVLPPGLGAYLSEIRAGAVQMPINLHFHPGVH